MKKALAVLSILLIYSIHVLCASNLKENPGKGDDIDSLLEEALSLAEEYPEKAIVMANEALDRLNRKKDAILESRAYFVIGEARYYQGQLMQAIENYKKAVGIDVVSGNDRTSQHITLLGNIGYFYDHLDQKVLAIDYYEQALQLARDLGDREEIAANLSNIGQLKTLQGNYEEAIQYMEEALAIDRELGDESVIATDLNTLGRLYESWGMYEKAIDYLEQALAIDERLGREDRMAIRYNSMGLVYKGWKKYDMALESFQKALEIDRKLDNAERVALRCSNIGSTYLAMGKANKAIEFLTPGLAYFQERDMTSYLASGYLDMGRAYLLLNNYSRAEEYLNHSLGISGREDYKTWRLGAMEALTELYSSKGRHDLALQTYRKFVELKDSVFTAENQVKLTEFQAKYDLSIKQQENELLKKNAEIHEKERTVMILVFSVTGLFMIALLMALLYRLKVHQNRRIISEKEKEELVLDLEKKNNELTYNAMSIIRNNETVSRIAEAVEEAIEKGEDPANLKQVIHQLHLLETDKGWKEFELRFMQTHRDFYESLNGRFPDLTMNERKLCAFLRLDMSTKDIASITHQSVHSINVARTRLRKKLGIDQTDESLVNFLQNL